jgi:hypothetical protein
VPAKEVLPPTASKGAIAVGRDMETELFVKLPLVTNAQYSEVLLEANVAFILPPEFPIVA